MPHRPWPSPCGVDASAKKRPGSCRTRTLTLPVAPRPHKDTSACILHHQRHHSKAARSPTTRQATSDSVGSCGSGQSPTSRGWVSQGSVLGLSRLQTSYATPLFQAFLHEPTASVVARFVHLVLSATIPGLLRSGSRRQTFSGGPMVFSLCVVSPTHSLVLPTFSLFLTVMEPHPQPTAV